MLETLILGFHLGSVHVPAKAHHNNVNPGIYVRVDSLVAGTYRNSIDRQTTYVGYSQPLGHGLELMGGLATGYRKECTQRTYKQGHKVITETTCLGFSRGAIAPVLGLTYSPGKFMGVAPRFWLVPGVKGASTVIHASVEF